MSLFDSLFKNRPKTDDKIMTSFKMLNGYVPRFTSFAGSVYESELIRSVINARATQIAKLKVEIKGSAQPYVRAKLKHRPNQFQTWYQFMYRLSTILDVNNTAFICPIYDNYGRIDGVYCPLPSKCEIVAFNNVPYLRYEFNNGSKAAIEFSACGIMTKYQYKNDFFGEKNEALFPTLDLIEIQNQGIEEAVKSSASYRFMARVNNFTKAEDLAKERKRFTTENFSSESKGGGMLLFPNTYTDIKQLENKPYVVDAEQMKIIKDNVFDYFGINEDVLTNKAYGDAWTAFYEGAVEPFAIQFSEVMSSMLFTMTERSFGNYVFATANRLQYMSNKDKLDVSSQLLDRGILSINDVREIWNLSPVEGGDDRIIRGEYYNATEKISEDDESISDDGNGEDENNGDEL